MSCLFGSTNLIFFILFFASVPMYSSNISGRFISNTSSLLNSEAKSPPSHNTEWVGLTNEQDFFTKNKKLHRPMSPHLTVYRFPLPAILSVAHRGTGIALTGVVCAAGIGLAVQPLQFYLDAIQVINRFFT